MCPTHTTMMQENAPILAPFLRDGNERLISANYVEKKGKATFSLAQASGYRADDPLMMRH